MIDGLPLSFFFPLVVHALAGLTTGVIGILAFSAPKRWERHPRWGRRYLWAYTVVFLTATILTAERWEADASLFILAVIGYGFALCGYGARRFRQEPRVRHLLGKQWVVIHIVVMIGSYVVLWTAFYVDNAQLAIWLAGEAVASIWFGVWLNVGVDGGVFTLFAVPLLRREAEGLVTRRLSLVSRDVKGVKGALMVTGWISSDHFATIFNRFERLQTVPAAWMC